MYFAFIMVYVGPRPSFHYVWLVLGTLLRGIVWMIEQKKYFLIPEVLRFMFIGVIIVGLILLIAMEARVFSTMWAKPRQTVKYIIVLGACVRGTRVTRSLSYRLKKAAAYAKEHPHCMLVVSGGQGPGEDITEAQAMNLYLQNLGISSERILLEDQSVNTRENLIFSRKIILSYENSKWDKGNEQIGGKEKRLDCAGDNMGHVHEEDLAVAICSNNFHIYRAMALAAAVGKWKVYGLAARTDPFMWLSFTVREGVALLKEMLFGHIPWK